MSSAPAQIRSLAANCGKYKVKLVKGAFQHSDPAINAISNDRQERPTLYPAGQTSLENFGIVVSAENNESLEIASLLAWNRLMTSIHKFNQTNANAKRVLVYLSRHAQGWHNEVLTHVGHDWNSGWMKIDNTSDASAALKKQVATMGQVVPENIGLFDPSLTPRGVGQATVAGKLFNKHSLPFPKAIWVSPMTRSLQTTRIILSHLPAAARASGLEIREYNRERFGENPCDRRHPTEWIQDSFGTADAPGWTLHSDGRPGQGPLAPIQPLTGQTAPWKVTFEPGFYQGPDPYWTPARETEDQLALRGRAILEDIAEWTTANWEANGSGPLFLATHGYICTVIQQLIGFPDNWIPAQAEIIPVVLEIESRS